MAWTVSREADLTASADQIQQFWQQFVSTGEMVGEGGVMLAYAWCIPAKARATIVLSSGRIEAYLKYQEVIFDLYNNGFAVFIIDHRGQGLSGRMTDNPHQGYVQRFADYVNDFTQFTEQVVKPNQPEGPRFLVAHSMGCAIAALSILNKPELFQRAVFCSPMFGIRPALPAWLANGLLNWSEARIRKQGMLTDYFIGQRDYHPVAFTLNRLTHSQARYQCFRTLYDEQPELQLGGVTVAWLRQAMAAMDEIEQRAAELALPCLMISAGSDTVVDNKRQQRVAAKMPQVSTMTVQGAFHELLIEQDDMRLPVVERILDFLS